MEPLNLMVSLSFFGNKRDRADNASNGCAPDRGASTCFDACAQDRGRSDSACIDRCAADGRRSARGAMAADGRCPVARSQLGQRHREMRGTQHLRRVRVLW